MNLQTVKFCLVTLAAAVFLFNCADAMSQKKVSFNRDIRPILASKCFVCHGRDEHDRQVDLRLDLRDEAINSGVIEPGEPAKSELIHRVFSDDEDEVMPPSDAENPLSEDQKKLLQQWITEGARYEKHWSFVKPTRPAIPSIETKNWARNPIDYFVHRRMQQHKLNPSPEADRYALVRRVYLDLIGLPPTISEADAFVKSDDPQAYEKLVDKLLKSQRYGERWAQPWLDLARYSDTNGYEKDRPRSIWPYRDWVIRALNKDLPFDRFTIDQIAGDMLPQPTPDQMIATGFHRNTMLNEEGGIDPLEYRYLAMVDRVATSGVVWMGLTMGCAQCHTHKYDPITHRDYFQMMALLNNADEPDYFIPDPSKTTVRERLEVQIKKLEDNLAAKFPPVSGDAPLIQRRAENFQREFNKWLEAKRKVSTEWSTFRPALLKTNLPRLELLDDGSIFSSGDISKRDVYELTFDLTKIKDPIKALRLEALPDDRLPARGPGRTYYEGRKGDFFVSEIILRADQSKIEIADASQSYPDSKRSKRNAAFDGEGSTGWQPGARKGQRLQLVLNLKQPVKDAAKLHVTIVFERHYAASLGRFRFSMTSRDGAVANHLPAEIESILARKSDDRISQTEMNKLKRQFVLTSPLLSEARKEIEALKKKIPPLSATMVMKERPADHTRATYRHHRGEFLSPKERVDPKIPELFTGQDDANKSPSNRLEFARWLVSDENPLAARVAVNRAWYALFGRGLVESTGDFGVRSPPPTHPQLLDWLAVEFMKKGWSMKQLHRLIVTSATYRQSSNGSPDSFSRDRQNQWLARGPRFRVSGEMVRDIILKSSGLLSDKMYGPGVRPPQPRSVTALAYGATAWKPSVGEDRYRRSIYTFRKRTAAFAAYTVFDSPTGENCVVRRNRSNTPLQALTVLNDQMYLEFARALARKTVNQDLERPEDEMVFIFRSLLTRPPDERESVALLDFFKTQKSRFDLNELDEKLVTGDGKATSRQAAWTMVARVIMNLDETLTKQ